MDAVADQGDSPPVPDTPDPYSEFHSHETGAPFQHCIACGLPLDDPELPFLVAKSFRGSECIFEYAICDHCRANMAREFSRESRRRLDEFFRQQVNLERRSMLLALGPDPTPWTARCAACATPRADMPSYSIGAVFLGHNMLFDPYPLCLCGPCEDNIQNLISRKTRDIWDEFVETHFDGPPAHLLDLPVGGKPLIF